MYFYPRKWLITSYLLIVIPEANFQIPVPMYPMMPPPMPVAHAIPIVIKIPNLDELTSTTTTTATPEKNSGQGILVPLPMPMPYHMPFPMPVPVPPPNLPRKSVTTPPCPPCVCNPSCTPDFYSYCSPCHRQCRCQNKQSQSRGYAVPAIPSPIIMVPFIGEKMNSEDSDYSDSNSCSDESRRKYTRKNKRNNKNGNRFRRKRKHRFSRRNLKSINTDDESDFVKPILTYVSDNGNVKLRRQLSENEAADLISDNDLSQQNDVYETVQIAADVDEDKKPQVVIRNVNNRQYILKQGSNREILGVGKKELIFKPPQDRKISNLSVSFQIT